MNTLPVIGTNSIGDGPEALRAIGRAVGDACRDTGFFYVRGGPAADLREAADYLRQRPDTTYGATTSSP